MEEVDTIVIDVLRRELGCDIDDEVKSIKQLTTSVIYQATILYLSSIDPNYEGKFPNVLPPNTSASVNICTEMAKAIKEAGYRGEIGFHNILYPNPNDTRKILLFLEQKRPKNIQIQNKESDDYFQAMLGQQLGKLQKETWTPAFTRAAWALPSEVWELRTEPVRPAFSLSSVQRISNQPKLIDDFWRDQQPLITSQCLRKQNVVPSVLEFLSKEFADEKDEDKEAMDSGLEPWEFRLKKKRASRKRWATTSGLVCLRAGVFSDRTTPSYKVRGSKLATVLLLTVMLCRITSQLTSKLTTDAIALEDGRKKRKNVSVGLLKGTRFSHQVEFREKSDVSLTKPNELSEQELLEAREREIQELDTVLSEASTELGFLVKEMDAFSSSLRRTEATLSSEQRKKQTQEQELRVKKKTYDLLDDAENNIRKLQELAQKLSATLKGLAAKWEERRVPLFENYRQLREAFLSGQDGSKELMKKIKVLQEDMQTLKTEIQKRDEKQKQLLDILQQLPQDMNRSNYTQRILEVVKNVKKQKIDIDKILIDTRNLKKEKSIIIDTLHREFHVTSDLVFQEASKTKDAVAKQSYKDLVSLHENFKQLTELNEVIGTTKNNSLDLEGKIDQITQKTADMDINLNQVTQDLERIRRENNVLQERLAR
eukprot:TRINITY_DN3928_c0_g1_i1.p1 TRINITY_DN3928_c0_g1~~TRINITY_DN3928_c0_g1_i1.p1  ORF type:complete len:654 (-),score=157.66 TRINITY_DN3928_c0_g1_i1:45-2006(-)